MTSKMKRCGWSSEAFNDMSDTDDDDNGRLLKGGENANAGKTKAGETWKVISAKVGESVKAGSTKAGESMKAGGSRAGETLKAISAKVGDSAKARESLKAGSMKSGEIGKGGEGGKAGSTKSGEMGKAGNTKSGEIPKSGEFGKGGSTQSGEIGRAGESWKSISMKTGEILKAGSMKSGEIPKSGEIGKAGSLKSGEIGRPGEGLKGGSTKSGEIGRAAENLKAGSMKSGEILKAGSMKSGEILKAGSLKSGEILKAGSMKSGEILKAGSLKSREVLKAGSMKSGEILKAGEGLLSKVIHEGWMARCRRRKICRSYINMRYFILGSHVLCYYKRRPQANEVPTKTLRIDGNCRVEDRGLKVHHGHLVYSLSVYNKKEKRQRMTMASFNIQDAQVWKEKIEFVIDQNSSIDTIANANLFYVDKSAIDDGMAASSSDAESQYSVQEDEVVNPPTLSRRMTIGKGLPESIIDWTYEIESRMSNQNTTEQVSHKMHWHLVRCQNGLRIFEELHDEDYLPGSCSRAMKAIGVIEASCDDIFELVMNTDGKRFEWDCSFQQGSLIEEVDGHTAILYQRLQLDWFPMLVWPRDLCYVRYWRRNGDGSYVVLFRSKEHRNCVPKPGFVRAHIESGGFVISPLEPRNGISRSQVQHLMQVDLKGWVVGSCRSFQHHCLLQMLNSVAGLREWFSQTDQRETLTRISGMASMNSDSAPPIKGQISQESSIYLGPLDNHIDVATKKSMVIDESSEDDEEFHIARPGQKEGEVWLESKVKLSDKDDKDTNVIDLSCFSGTLKRNDHENGYDCWSVPDGSSFTVRGERYLSDKSKIPAGKYMMELVAVDWFKDTKRMDHVARREGCAVQVASEKGLFSLAINLQVPGSTHYSMVLYFVMKNLVPGSLMQRFVDGDDEFRNSRLKLIPSVRKGSWIVRQSVGSTPCLLGKALDCNYIRGSNYLEIDVDIGSSAVAKGVLGLVCGVITSLVVDIAFLVQANTQEELPERLIGAVRGSHIELSSAVNPEVEMDDSQSGESSN